MSNKNSIKKLWTVIFTYVIKRNAFGFKRYDRLRLKVLLYLQLKDLKGFQVG